MMVAVRNCNYCCISNLTKDRSFDCIRYLLQSWVTRLFMELHEEFRKYLNQSTRLCDSIISFHWLNPMQSEVYTGFEGFTTKSKSFLCSIKSHNYRLNLKLILIGSYLSFLYNITSRSNKYGRSIAIESATLRPLPKIYRMSILRLQKVHPIDLSKKIESSVISN